MKRNVVLPRNNWENTVEGQSLVFHHTKEGLYWNESVYYSFSELEFGKIEQASKELHKMCLDAIDYIIEKDYFYKFGIVNEKLKELIIQSWNKKEFHLYGRFDLSVNANCSEIKMLEYNADTPTSVLEVGLIQNEWESQVFNHDAKNLLQNRIINRFKILKENLQDRKLFFAAINTDEDRSNTMYLQQCAKLANIETEYRDISFFKWNKEKEILIDRYGESVTALFKLYPWEWIISEDFKDDILENYFKILWIEPVWKMLLSNKAILPILWEMYPKHPNLLEAYFDSPREMVEYMVKPLLSREGANIQMYKNGNKIIETKGEYVGDVIYQKLQELPDFDGRRPVIGSWIVGDEFAGVGIRESSGPITDNFSQFIPSLVL